MNILLATSEALPFIKTGGLADVVPMLAHSLAKLRHKVSMVLPGYDAVLKQLQRQQVVSTYTHPVTLQKVEIIVSQDLLPVKLIIVKHPLFEHKINPYVDGNARDWANNFETFSLFSWAVAKVAYDKKVTGATPYVDVLVSNDWQTGLTPVYVKHANEEIKAHVKTAYVIHNIAFPGIFSYEHYPQLGLPNSYFQLEGMEYHGQISFQKAGLFFADKIFTVSPQYAEEIKTYHQFGMGFEGILRHRSKDVVGILNGVDYDVWSPQIDTHIAQQYGLTTLSAKEENKKDIMNTFFSVDIDKGSPLVGMVTRLSEQKGIDVLIDFLHKDFFHKYFNLLILGSGDLHWTKQLEGITAQHKNVAFVNTYSEAIAHKIIAGSDVFFMPSRFEPCGLTQLYAMKYGTIPLVSPVGGLKNSVIPFTGDNEKEANGLYLAGIDIESFVSSFNVLHHIFAKKSLCNKLRKNAMKADFSWMKSAKEYEDHFKQLL